MDKGRNKVIKAVKKNFGRTNNWLQKYMKHENEQLIANYDIGNRWIVA
jgi:hypothetical protein